MVTPGKRAGRLSRVSMGGDEPVRVPHGAGERRGLGARRVLRRRADRLPARLVFPAVSDARSYAKARRLK